MEMEVDLEQTDEEYVIQKAKEALKIDPFAAKAWMLTAKSLYPNNFWVQVSNLIALNYLGVHVSNVCWLFILV